MSVMTWVVMVGKCVAHEGRVQYFCRRSVGASSAITMSLAAHAVPDATAIQHLACHTWIQTAVCTKD